MRDKSGSFKYKTVEFSFEKDTVEEQRLLGSLLLTVKIHVMRKEASQKRNTKESHRILHHLNTAMVYGSC